MFSADLNDRFEFNPVAVPAIPITPPLPRPERVLLPYQRQQLPPMSAAVLGGGGGGGGGNRNRPPLGEVALNVLVSELKTLENENTVLKKQVALQGRLIVGFCGLHVHERENRPPA